jgi:hypothetical protein
MRLCRRRSLTTKSTKRSFFSEFSSFGDFAGDDKVSGQNFDQVSAFAAQTLREVLFAPRLCRGDEVSGRSLQNERLSQSFCRLETLQPKQQKSAHGRKLRERRTTLRPSSPGRLRRGARRRSLTGENFEKDVQLEERRSVCSVALEACGAPRPGVRGVPIHQI